MISLNNPKTIWQLPNITRSTENLNRNDILLLSHSIPPLGSGFYFNITFDNLFYNLFATESEYGTVTIFNNINANNSIVYNNLQIDNFVNNTEDIINNLSATRGGIGITEYNENDLIYASNETTLSKLSSIPNSILLTNSLGNVIWETQDSLLNTITVESATNQITGLVKTNTFSTTPTVYLKEEIDELLPSLNNPLPIFSGGTGMTDLSGEAGNILTVNNSNIGYNLSTLESINESIIVSQDSVNGHFNINLPQKIDVTDEVFFQKVIIKPENNISNPSANSILDIQSLNKGVLLPKMPTTVYSTWTTPKKGLVIYDTTINKYVFFNGNNWEEIGIQEIQGISGLDGIENVNISYPTAGEDFLGFDGTNWVNINVQNMIDNKFTEFIPTLERTDLTEMFEANGTSLDNYILVKNNNSKLEFLNPQSIYLYMPNGQVGYYNVRESFYNYDSVVLADNPICFIPFHSEATTNNLSTHTGNMFRYGIGTHTVSFNYPNRVIKGYGNGITFPNSTGTNVISLNRTEHPVFNIYQNRTIEFWMKYDAGNNYPICYMADQGQYQDSTNWYTWCQFLISSNDYYYQTTGNKIGWYCQNSSGGEYRFNSNTSLINNSIYHIVYTLDTTTIKLYINGVLNNSGVNNQVSKTYGQLLIGRHNGTNLYPSPPLGTFSGFAFYDYVLTSEQILNHYNAGKA